MKNLTRLSKFFKYAAVVTFVVAICVLLEGLGNSYGILWSEGMERVVLYLIFMIPVIFASMAVSLRFIAKAIDPDYKCDRKKNREVSVVLPPD